MDCPKIPQIKYSDFGTRFREAAINTRIPICGGLELTYRCNLKCVHCYCNFESSEKELTANQWKDIIDQLADAGSMWLLITGGEPLLRKDFVDLYIYAKKKGMLPIIFTNGTLINDDIIKVFKDLPPYMVEITLYGNTRKTYESITGRKNSFEKCINNIYKLADNKIKLKLKTMILTKNVKDIFDMEAFAKKLGLDFRFDAAINSKLNGDKEPHKYRISPSLVPSFDFADTDRKNKWLDFMNYSLKIKATDRLYNCGAGLFAFQINPYGELQFCEMARTSVGNLSKNSFAELWPKFGEIRKNKRKKKFRCNGCDFITVCGQCPGWGELENGDPEKPVDYLCQMVYFRLKSLNLLKKGGALEERIFKTANI